MAITFSTPGQYTLGGISAPRTGVTQAFQAGVSANLGRQEARQVMQARDQQMRIAASEEQRRQQAFEAAQAARAAAAANAARQRAAFEAYARAATAAPPPTTAGVRRPVDAGIRAEDGNFPLATPSQRSFVIPELGFPAPPGAAAAPTAGVQFPSVFNQGGGGGGGGGGGDAGMLPERMFMTPESMATRAGLAGMPTRTPPTPSEIRFDQAVQLLVANGMPREVIQGYIDQGVDLSYLLAQLPPGTVPGAVSGIDAQRPENIFADTTAAVEAFTELPPGATTGTPLYDQLVSLSVPAAPVAAETPEPKRTGQDPFIVEEETPTGPIAGLSPAGTANPVKAAEAAALSAPDGDTSAYLISNPNLVLDLQTQLARERQVLEARLQYAQQTGNTALFDQTIAALNSKERVVNENLISGQIAILAAQQDNFGPLQEFLQRAYPNDNIEVVPYTNGTVSFFVNGQEDGEPMRTADLLDGLAQTFNTEYREALAAAAARSAERETFLFENALLQELQAAREISVAQARVLAELEATYGEVTPVGDLPSGDKLFQTFVPERGFVQFRIVEAGQPLLNGQPAASATVEEIPPGTLR